MPVPSCTLRRRRVSWDSIKFPGRAGSHLLVRRKELGGGHLQPPRQRSTCLTRRRQVKAAQLRQDSSDQFGQIGGFDEILQGPGIQAINAALQLSARREHHHGNLLLRQALHKTQPILSRQAQIDHHQVGPSLQELHIKIFCRACSSGLQPAFG